MKKVSFILYYVFAVHISIAQDATQLFKNADSLYKIKEYKNSAVAYNAGIQMQGKNAAVARFVSSAGSWALAKMPDSALYLLGIIAQSDKVSKTNLQQIEYGPDFTSLHADKRWQTVLERIRRQAEKNGFPHI